MTFGVGQPQFIDSLQLMSESLDKFSSKLTPEDLLITRKESTNVEIELLRCKGVYIHEYVDCFDRFNKTQLPPKEKFYSNLNKCGIKEDDFDHAHKVWETFGCNNCGDYHDTSLKTDVLLLLMSLKNSEKHR